MFFSLTYVYVDNIYVSDSSNNRIRKIVASSGHITTIAGTGSENYSGDGSAATSATLNGPCDIALDSSGMLVYNHFVL